MKKIVLFTVVMLSLASTFLVSCASKNAEPVFVEVPAGEGEK